MPTCEKVKIRNRKVCAGDMDKLIMLQTRNIAGDSNSVDFLLNFTNQGEVWAAVQTAASGESIFDEVGTETIITHRFYINFIPDFTEEIWIEFKGKRYDIVNVENLDERDEFLKLSCVVRGSVSREATKA